MKRTTNFSQYQMSFDSCKIVCGYPHVFIATTADMSRRWQLLLPSLVKSTKAKTEKKRISKQKGNCQNRNEGIFPTVLSICLCLKYSAHTLSTKQRQICKNRNPSFAGSRSLQSSLSSGVIFEQNRIFDFVFSKKIRISRTLGSGCCWSTQ
jgi:hypothetical protein